MGAHPQFGNSFLGRCYHSEIASVSVAMDIFPQVGTFHFATGCYVVMTMSLNQILHGMILQVPHFPAQTTF